MNFKDRTSEFYNLVERIKKRGKSQTIVPKRQTTPHARSEFARMAAQLGRSIATTSEKLEQLTTRTFYRFYQFYFLLKLFHSHSICDR